MPTVTKLTVSNATQVGSANWVTPQDIPGKQEIPSPAPRGPCVIQAFTTPDNSPAEWKQIAWAGGDPVPGKPNQRLVSRQQAQQITVGATIQGRGPQVTVWVLWAAITVQTSGPRPPRAQPWSAGAWITAGNDCGAFVIDAITMGENARGQVVAVAALAPAGVGRVISAAAMHTQFKFRRQITAHDFVDGQKRADKKTFSPWAADDSQPKLQTLDPGPDDRLYDTDGPDLPGGAQSSSETYNNFRQWLEWAGAPCSGYGLWYFRARWKDQKVTLKEVDQGAIDLPQKPYYPAPP
jgi:hypothetical protein